MFVDFFENLERLKIPNLWKQHHQSHPNSGGFKVGLNLKSSWQNTWIQNLPRANSTVTSLWHVGPVCFEHFGGVYKDIWVVGEGFLENHISCKRTCRINCIPPTPPPNKGWPPHPNQKKTHAGLELRSFLRQNFGVNKLVYMYILGSFSPPYRMAENTWVIRVIALLIYGYFHSHWYLPLKGARPTFPNSQVTPSLGDPRLPLWMFHWDRETIRWLSMCQCPRRGVSNRWRSHHDLSLVCRKRSKQTFQIPCCFRCFFLYAAKFAVQPKKQHLTDV